jgi:hypothetical protein
MKRRAIVAVIVVFIEWVILDFIMHGVILNDAYKNTATLWRSMEQMKMGLIYSGTLIFSIVFVAIYTIFFSEKGMIPGLRYGLLFGVGVGFSMGYGSYAVMPIPHSMALTWFIGTLIETTVAGLILGFIIKQ